jgi:membrane-bound lytic murein transglycosylase D
MAEFGAETYSVPPEFLQEVKRFIARYQGPDRATTERALGESRSNMETMRKIFEGANLPPDLACMVLAESGMSADGTSAAGAVGWWQLTAATAEHYGLRVGKVDDRRSVRKSTEAAAKYVRDLILDFGTGSSVMLALAAYDVGPGKVKQAIRNVKDPIRQRDFWYLYRTRALPEETREYVPKVIAAMIIARQPERYGF